MKLNSKIVKDITTMIIVLIIFIITLNKLLTDYESRQRERVYKVVLIKGGK